MPRRLSGRRGASLALASLFALATAAPAAARESQIINNVRVGGNPDLIDLIVTSVSYSEETQAVTVTGIVTCEAPEDTQVFIDDVIVMQRRGGTTVEGRVSAPAECNQPFTATVSAASGSFRPGRTTVRVVTFACARNCTGEQRELKVALLP